MSLTAQEAHRFSTFAQQHRYGVLSGLLQNIVSILNSLILVRLVLSHLGNLDAGTWLLFLSVGAYVSLLDFGIAQNLTREVAFAMSHEQERAARLTAAIRAAARLVLPICMASLLLLLAVGYWYFPSTDITDLQTVNQAWIIFSLGAVTSILSSSLLAAVFGAGNLVADKIGRAVTQLLGLFVMSVVVLRTADLRSMALVWLLQNALLLVFALWEFRKIHLAAQTPPALVQEYSRKFTGTMGYWTTMGVGNVLFFNFGGAVVGAQVSVAAVPQFDIPWRIAGIILAALSVYTLTGAPRISSMYALGQREAVQRELILLSGPSVLIAAFMALGTLWMGQSVISVWTAGKVQVSGSVLLLTASFIVLEAHTRLHMTFINALGQFVVARSTLVLGLLALTLAWFLSRSQGVVGVLLALNLALLLTNAWVAPRRNLRNLQLGAGRYFRSLTYPLLCAGVSGIVIALLERVAFQGLNFTVGLISRGVVLLVLLAGSWLLSGRLYAAQPIQEMDVPDTHAEEI